MVCAQLPTSCSLVIYHKAITNCLVLTEEDGPTDMNTLVFKLKVKCERNPNAAADETDPKKKYINSHGMDNLGVIQKSGK